MINQPLPYSTRQPGFSLIELMVAITIALVMSLAVFGILSTSEGKKRTLTSVNDINQSGNYALYQLDNIVRSAGSGIKSDGHITFNDQVGSSGSSFTGSNQDPLHPTPFFGCQLFAHLSGQGVILPFNGTMADPFSNINSQLSGAFRLAPIIIAKNATAPNISGQDSDALIVMSGAAGYGEIPVQFTATPNSTPSSTYLTLNNTLSFRPNDLVLVADLPMTNNAACMIEQVDPSFSNNNGMGTVTVNGTTSLVTALPLGGSRYANPINTQNLTTFTVTHQGQQPIAMNLGNVSGNMPSFQIIGVGNNNVLYSYDLLQAQASYNTSLPIADGVFELHALYGIDDDNDGNGLVDKWIDPGASGYDYLSLESGTLSAATNLQKIKAIRIGLIMRTSLPEKPTSPPVTPGPLTLFSDLGSSLTYTRNLSPDERNYRYRVIETTIPIRNQLLLN